MNKNSKNRDTVRLQGIKKITFQSELIPPIKDNEILLNVMACSICGSDIRIYNNGNKRVSQGSIIGHEISGIIENVGNNVKHFDIGDKVSLGADVPCDGCYYCDNDMVNNCENNYAIGHQLEGGFTTHMVVDAKVLNGGPIKNFYNVSYEEAALAEPVACCINGYKQVFHDYRKINNIVVFGAGAIGIILAKLGKYYGAKNVIVVDIDKNRLAKLKSFKEIDYAIDGNIDITDEIYKITNGKMADTVFTACPAISAQKDAMKIIGKKGFVNFFGGLANNELVPLSTNDIHYKEIVVTGSHGSNPKDHELAIQLIDEKKIIVSDLISHRYKLCDIQQAYDKMEKKECLKICITNYE